MAGNPVHAADEASTPLYDACSEGDASKVAKLLKAGANPNASVTFSGGCCYSSHEYPIHAAAENGNARIVRMLLDHGAKINPPGDTELTPLHRAVGKGDRETVKLLLSRGAAINSRSRYAAFQGSPLESACAGGNFAMVEYLVEHGVAPKDSPDCLGYASYKGKPELLRFLIGHGASLKGSKAEGGPIMFAARDGNLATVKLLVSLGARLQTENEDGKTPIHEAAWSGNLKLMTYLLDHGADVNSTIRRNSNVGRSPLQYATSIPMIRLLLSRGADVNHADDDGDTALHHAKGPVAIHLLLDHGARVDLKNRYQQLPLHTLASNSETTPEAIRELVGHGSNLAATDHMGETALEGAAHYGKPEVVRALLECGARPTKTAMKHALDQRSPEIALILKSYGAHVPPEARTEWPDSARQLLPLKRSRPEK